MSTFVFQMNASELTDEHILVCSKLRDGKSEFEFFSSTENVNWSVNVI